MNRSRTLALALAATAFAAASAGAVIPASAADGTIRQGSCSGASDWKLKASHDNNRIEVEFEVDSNRVGQRWTWRLADNGSRVASGTAVTRAPSGSFEVARRIADKPGRDRIVATARNAATGETCRGVVTV